MIKLPDPAKAFEYENNFYLSCDINRMGKLMAHYELYKAAADIPGAVVEAGVFKGAAFTRFAAFRELCGNPYSKKLLGFDTFGKFPETGFARDKKLRKRFIDSAGEQSISKQQLQDVLQRKGVARNVELIEGDITKTVPLYLKKHPELKISLLNLDVDIYEPSVTVLEYLYPRITKGGILVLDDYGVFPGETKAVDDYFKGSKIKIRKFAYCVTPCYIIKD